MLMEQRSFLNFGNHFAISLLSQIWGHSMTGLASPRAYQGDYYKLSTGTNLRRGGFKDDHYDGRSGEQWQQIRYLGMLYKWEKKTR